MKNGLEGMRLFFFMVGDDNSPVPISQERYDALLDQDPGVAFPQYAGRLLRFAVVLVTKEGMENKELFDVHCFSFPFDSGGKLDTETLGTELETILGYRSSPPFRGRFGAVVDARPRFAERRFDAKYKWTPTPDIRDRIRRAVFKEETPGDDRR